MDLQLNISVTKKDNKKPSKVNNKNIEDYKFLSKPVFSGTTIARKRPAQQSSHKQANEAPQNKVPKISKIEPSKTGGLSANLLDLSENKGKYHGKSYQDLNDDIQIKQKPRSGGWISSLFKNNPDVPRVGQRAVKPLVEKVFTGNNFSDLNIHPHSVANIQQNLHLKEMMTVQQNAIPIILQGRDVLIRSQTGSGKTLAYALPIIEGLQAIRPKVNRHDGILAIVVVPTRELAVQTYELFVKLVKPFMWLVPGLLSGGQKRKAEKARLRKGLSILVGTPGRINDHLRHTKSLNFSKTGCLILDEADRLLDMGYEKDVAAIVKAIEDHKKAATYDPMALMKETVNKKTFPEAETDCDVKKETNEESDKKHNLTNVFLSHERQTILLSATLTKAVENLAGLTMIDPVFVDTSEGRAVVADSLKYNPSGESSITKSDNTLLCPKKENEIQEVTQQETKKKILPNTTNQKVDARRGLNPFSGSNFPDLFKTNQDDSIENSKMVICEKTVNSDSDSDSDYEYFKEQRNLTVKELTDELIEDDLQPSNIGSTFDEAVKSALIEDELILPASVNQTFLVVPMKLRLVTLCSHIIEHCVLNKKGGKMIIFMATLEMVDYHADLIETALTGKETNAKKKKKQNESASNDQNEDSTDDEFVIDYEKPAEGLVPVDIDLFKLHGSMPHEQRIEVFKQFRTARAGVLICTDVAARGLDVPRVDLVLQYCAPASATDYVHRVGRTGRATHVGAAVMFLLPSETEFVRYLEQKRIRLRQADERACLEAARALSPGAPTAPRAAVALQARLEHLAHSNRDWLARASRAYTSWVRFYAGYPREVRALLDARALHLGHAAKAFALRDAPAALARRARAAPAPARAAPANRLTVHEQDDKKRPGFAQIKFGKTSHTATSSKQSSMHSASEYDSGLARAPDAYTKNKKKKNR